MMRAGTKAELILNGKAVGRIAMKGHDNSWYFGEFEPGDGFSEFSTLFGRWSLLMHADDGPKLSKEASEELRQAEYDIDMLKAEIRILETGQRRLVRQINIDGKLVDWKE